MTSNTHSLSTLRQIELMRSMQRAANTRATAEEAIRQRFAKAICEVDANYEEVKTRLELQYTKDQAIPEARYKADRERIEEENRAQREDMERSFQGARDEIEAKSQEVLRRAEKARKETRWQIMTVFDAEKGEPRRCLDETVLGIRQQNQGLAVIERDATAILKLRRQWTDAVASSENSQCVAESTENTQSPMLDGVDLQEHVASQVALAQESLVDLHRQRLPKIYEGGTPFGIAFLAWLVAIAPSGYLLGWSKWTLWLPASVVLGVGVGVGLLFWLFPRARRSSQTGYEEVIRRIATARLAEQSTLAEAKRRSEREAEDIVAKRDEGIATANEQRNVLVRESRERRATELANVEEVFPAKLEAIVEDRVKRLAEIDEKYPRILEDMADIHAGYVRRNEEEYLQRKHQIITERDIAFDAMANDWREAMREFDEAVDSMDSQCGRLFPEWPAKAWKEWKPPTDLPPAIRFGHGRLDLARIKHAISKDERLQTRQTAYDLPALMALTEHSTLVLTTGEEGRQAAVASMQSVMLRFLTAAPPGKVRFTIIDPLGLGDNFSAFMHLTDYDELLVTNRIWTESGHIENRLADLTEHMENVIQKYLRSEFASIHDYNKVAGEVAEPYRVLVVANFPANFSDMAIRRLSAIVAGGARCGVYTILGVDQTLKMPHDFPLDDLISGAAHLDWDSGKFVWRYGPMEHLPLSLESPPRADRFREIVSSIGELAVDANRVEVPFSSLAPSDSDVWTEDCSRELVIPIGRTGATQWQAARLGRGTAQHLLIAGKTGSGKSTFLHALIVSAALRYSPDELRFYLIDFKKGVEFKTYASGGLPHADVIAIESEREFGLSVLDRLDRELRRRGDLFRGKGVQDLAGFRANEHDTPMPRILLVIDEFQELFVEDDKIAQEASLLLDRLVRQGRAFGIHVLLGSQTLAGAYSLARSTLGQMAIRIALQCSETDAHLILSEENSAARLLSRPGEAIYNDQNGLVAGNHPFQVVWLTESERERYVEILRERSRATEHPAAEPLVFEGNVPAGIADNDPLATAIESTTTPSGPPRAWLGAAVQIKDPTSAVFRRQGGSNLLVVGQRETLALGMMSAALVSLGAQQEQSPSTFYILDGTRPESPEAGYWKRLAELLPFDIKGGNVRDTGAVIATVADIVQQRTDAENDTAPPVFLFIHNLGRFRDLRRQEDEFSFSSFSASDDDEKMPSPDKRLREILREGPAWGVHTLIWADSYNGVQRVFDRATLREVELRAVMQISATDSSSLIDSPLAGRLGPNRAYLYSEDEGTIEKFRPYSPPEPEWLSRIANRLR